MDEYLPVLREFFETGTQVAVLTSEERSNEQSGEGRLTSVVHQETTRGA
jgi:hypothetical protein